MLLKIEKGLYLECSLVAEIQVNEPNDWVVVKMQSGSEHRLIPEGYSLYEYCDELAKRINDCDFGDPDLWRMGAD